MHKKNIQTICCINVAVDDTHTESIKQKQKVSIDYELYGDCIWMSL